MTSEKKHQVETTTVKQNAWRRLRFLSYWADRESTIENHEILHSERRRSIQNLEITTKESRKAIEEGRNHSRLASKYKSRRRRKK